MVAEKTAIKFRGLLYFAAPCRKEDPWCRMLTHVYTVSQKGTSVLLSITLANINRFSNFFTVEFGNKFATILLLHCPPHLKCVTALPCKLKIVNFVILQAQ